MLNLFFVNKNGIIYLVPKRSIERRNKSMVYFYSALVDTAGGEIRIDGTIELYGKIRSSNDWYVAQKQLKDNIRSEMKEKNVFEIYNIVLTAFNPI